ncbi:flagellar motor switch phosphatase FliY [Geomicrobium sp. JCM 19038]|uniref:flagellar motor switch phosphatase FliY n=1 Tax=Geomicrobium sp. JCM 19038 TaxID=1460635 RepID=UPI00045F493E|nr:flagellar motor switch phosphatase FliY [Geomicrobium sp. JCM 19038]GAK07536.1 flagellar motor switch protein FliN [Geomicrobium sp. JCM 19038]
MNDEPLSQEEINQLLAGLEEEKDASSSDDVYPPAPSKASTNVTQFLTEIEKDAIGEIGNISFGTASTTLSQLLNQKVSITTPVVDAVKAELLHEEFPNPHVSIHVEYKQGFKGANVLVIKQHDAQIIADLMLGGDGTKPPEQLEEIHISAVQEAMNQMMGSSSTSLSTIFNTRVDISPPGINMLDLEKGSGLEYLPQEGTIIKVSFRLKIGELIDSIIMQLITVEFAKELVEKLMNPALEMAPTMDAAPPIQEETAPVMFHTNDVEPTEQQTLDTPVERHVSTPTPEPVAVPESRTEPKAVQKTIQPAEFANFEGGSEQSEQSRNLDILMDIPLDVTVQLGKTRRSIRDILNFTQGSIIELDKLAGEPVDILVNQRLVAKGEVVVIDENFGVRVTDIVSRSKRIEHLK